MHFLRKNCIWVMAAAVVVAAIAVYMPSSPSLVLREASTGKRFACYPFPAGSTFSVTFVHSVNQSPVTDYYRGQEDNSLLCYATKFHAYGAGIPESWPENAKVETSTDGIYVSNLHILLPDVTYIVGTVSDHTLTIGDADISLRELCGKNAEVLFKIE